MNIREFLVVVAIVVGVAACNDCEDQPCAADGYFYFNITDSIGGESLLYKDSSAYHYDSLRAAYRQDDQLAFLNIVSWSHNSVYFPLERSVSEYYLLKSGKVTDTIRFDYQVGKTECCGKRIKDMDVFLTDSLICQDCGGVNVEIVK